MNIGLSQTEINNLRFIFDINSHGHDRKSIYLNANREFTAEPTNYDKSLYAIRYIYNVGLNRVEKVYQESCQTLINACIQPHSNQRITVERTYQIFRAIFPELCTIQGNLESKLDKERAKQQIDSILNRTLFGMDDNIQKLKEINSNPRLAEARYALSLNHENASKLDGGYVHSVYKIYDRSHQTKLGIFKVLGNQSEEEISLRLREKAKINQKTTIHTTLPIEEESSVGLFQKFIKGETFLKNFKTTQSGKEFILDSRENIRQMHYMALFDLFNFNDDRHGNNFMIDKKGKIWAIDNELGEGYAWQNNSIWGYEIGKTILNQPLDQELKQHLLSFEVESWIMELDLLNPEDTDADKIAAHMNTAHPLFSSSLNLIQRIQANYFLHLLQLAVQQEESPTLKQMFQVFQLLTSTQQNFLTQVPYLKINDFQSFINKVLKK